MATDDASQDDKARDALAAAIAALVAALVADFALTASAIHALAKAIYQGSVDALIAAYADAATAVGVSPTIADAYAPDDATLTQLADDAQTTADEIAATYADDLTREATSLANAYADANGGTLGETAVEERVAKQTLARSLNEYATERAAAHSPILADYECGVAQHQGTRVFVQDALAARDNPDDTPLLDSTGAPLDMSDAVIAILPPDSSMDECAEWAGETFALDDFDSLPELPMHPNCPHEAIILLANGDEWEDDE